jgi:hypothetical protein
MVTFAGTTLPSLMTITTDRSSPYFTRLTYIRAVPQDSTLGNPFVPWAYDKPTFSLLANSTGTQFAPADGLARYNEYVWCCCDDRQIFIRRTLRHIRDLAFNDSVNYPIRLHAMKLIVIVTGSK